MTADSDITYLADYNSLTDLVRSQMTLERPESITAISGTLIQTNYIFVFKITTYNIVPAYQVEQAQIEYFSSD